MNRLDVIIAVSKATGVKVSSILSSKDIECSICRGILYIVCEKFEIGGAQQLTGKTVNKKHMEEFKNIINKNHKDMLTNTLEILRVTPPDSMTEYSLYRGKDYIRLETLSGVYEVIDASTKHFGKSTVGLKDGNILVYGIDLDDTLLDVIHQDIFNKISNLTIKEIRKAWGTSKNTQRS